MDPQIGADIFRHYYDYLQDNQPHLLVDFYGPGSMIVRMGDGVVMETASTMQEIEALVMTWHFSDIEYTCLSWQSWSHGLLVLALGSLRQAGFRGKHKFAQALFVAPDPDETFYIWNDAFSFIGYEDDESVTLSSSPDGNSGNDIDPNSLGNFIESDIRSQPGGPGPLDFEDLFKSSFIRYKDDESTTTSSSNRNSDNDTDPNSLGNVIESDIRSQPGPLDLQVIERCFTGYLDEKSTTITTTSLSSDGNSDNATDPNSLGNVIESDIRSQPGPLDFEDLFESGSRNNAHSDESTTTVEIDSLTSFPNLLDDIKSWPALTESVKSPGVKDGTLDQIQVQQQSSPEYVKGVLPDREDTDL